jgi:predicted NAD-dependent protein-ADP-ribosyltransferase YbiA (DUF1768 family)
MNTEDKIKFYSGSKEYYELSNFYQPTNPIKVKGKFYPTTEHWYQSKKVKSKYRCMFQVGGKLSSFKEAYKLFKEKNVKVGDKWRKKRMLGIFPKMATNPTHSKKLDIELKQLSGPILTKMRDYNYWKKVLLSKFNENPDLKDMLVNTNGEIIEFSRKDGSYWNQTNDGKGENAMGKFLTRIQNEY